jgi:hypothetical protein
MMPVIQPFPPGLTTPPPIGEPPLPVRPAPVSSDYARLRERRQALVTRLKFEKSAKKRGELAGWLRAITAEMLKMETRGQ